MGYSSMSFLDTKQEHDRWHHGLYRGLKINNPRKLYGQMRLNGRNWRKWYGRDDHYHDFAMLGAYGAKGAAIIVGMHGLLAAGLV